MERSSLAVVLTAISLLLMARPAFAQDSTVVFHETFNGVTVPNLPSGWKASGPSSWVTDTGVPSGSASTGLNNNLKHEGTATRFFRPPGIDLSKLTSGTLEYLARRTSGYGQTGLVVRASLDGGATFSITVVPAGAALPAASGVWARISVPLPAEILGREDVVLTFEAQGGEGVSANIRIDDLIIKGVSGGIIGLPAQLGFATEAGTSQSRSITVSNSYRRAVQLQAPTVAGFAFSISPSNEVSLESGGSFTYTVTFSPPIPNAYTGSLTIRHDFGEAVVPLTGSVGSNLVGFAAEASEAVELADTVLLPISLSYANATALQGLELTVTWDTALVTLLDVARGAAVAEPAAWTLAVHGGERTARVVLLGSGTTGLPAGSYGPLLVLRLRAAALTGAGDLPVRFAVTQAVGALATPTGDDAAVTIGTGTHTLTLRKRDVQFSVTPSSLEVGAVAVGASGTAVFTVSNGGGSGSLTVSGVASSSPLYAVAPASAVVAAGGSQAFTVTFTPTSLLFGSQPATLTLTHDGAGGSDTVYVSGLGQGGRGDAHADGMVELMDLVFLLDAILGRTSPGEPERNAVDLYPFSLGDGALDVRDATVLAHAVVNGHWPDQHALPPVLQPAPPAAFRQPLAQAEEDAVLVAPSEDGTALYLRHTAPIRGAQVILQVDGSGELDAGAVPGATLLLDSDPAERTARLVLFRADGGAIAPATHTLAVSTTPGYFRGASQLYATAVDTSRERLAVGFGQFAPGDTTGLPGPPQALGLGAPYPHPFVAGSAAPLAIPVALPETAHAELVVYDLLGRTVATVLDREHPAGAFTLRWNGRDAAGAPVAPGLYLLRLSSGGASTTRTVVLLR